MSEEYSRIKHLDYITMAIERMARNSFMCKGWAIVLTIAILAFNSAKTNIYAPFIAIAALFSLWWLDAFYLRLEKLFIELYEDVRKNDFSETPYTMDISSYIKKQKIPSEWRLMFTKSELPLYLPVLTVSAYIAICEIIASITETVPPPTI